MRRWEIIIPIRPKCVQSVRMGRGGMFVDKKVRQWKEAIQPYIRANSPGRPTKLPVRVVRFRYLFQCPKSTKKHVLEYIAAGGDVPYMGKADITDNMNKGVVDVCKGIVYEDDSQIWKVCGIEKKYGLKDGIELVFEETPDVILLNGKPGASLDDSKNEVQDIGDSII